MRSLRLLFFFGFLLFLLLAHDSVLHRAETEHHQEADAATHVQVNHLKVHPNIECAVLFGDLGACLVYENRKVNNQGKAQEVIHLKEQTEGTFLSLEVNCVQLNELV